MIIQKLRLKRGWSQQQLAEMSGLSTRTIQRIENGKTPSIESVKSLASVFEVNFLTLNGALTMNTETISPETLTEIAPADLQLSNDEKKAYKHVRKLKNFYKDLIVFTIVIIFLAVINWLTSDYWWVLWVFLGWGISFFIRAIGLFFRFPFFDADWEKRQRDKFLND